MKAFNDVTIESGSGRFCYKSAEGFSASAHFPLFLIREAWGAGVDYEDLADGYGAGGGTNGDWSGIRDSTHEAIEQMFERALNHFFPGKKSRT